MPAPANIAEFVEVVRRSGLVPDDRLQAELARAKATAAPPTVDQFVQALIRAGVLTRFQAKQMKLGRYKRFEIAGKYRLLELLGVGGMGAVYLCEHMFMKRLVALKVLPVDKLEDQSALLRFYREARAVAALDHPNIVRAYDIDKFEQLHFLVMEYVDGSSIQEVVARNGPFDPARAANYAAQSAHGLHHAHHLGMVHRDIKPGNLLLDRTGVVKILDMGLARFFEQKQDNVTEKFDANCVLGTADYLAPEQAVSNVVDIRADLYALGGSLYYMLTGQSPFPDGTIASKLMAHQTRDPRPVTEFRDDVPVELVEVLSRMMQKNPADRFQTPEELYEALSRWVEYPVPPPPEHEMPDLCPAVLALAGHATDKARASTARLTSAGTSPLGGGKPRSGFPPGVGRGHSDRPTPPNNRAPSQAQVPTATSSSSPTAPLPQVPLGRPPEVATPQPPTDSGFDLSLSGESSGRSSWAETRRPADSRNLWLLLGVAGGLVLALLAVVAFLAWSLYGSAKKPAGAGSSPSPCAAVAAPGFSLGMRLPRLVESTGQRA